jgi:hypothetical protein
MNACFYGVSGFFKNGVSEADGCTARRCRVMVCGVKLRGLITLLLMTIGVWAQKPVAPPDFTAIGALKQLPKEAAKRLARIEARDGNPWPQRWYVIVYEPSDPRGLHEYVFSEGKLIASRALSQFADRVQPTDVIGADAVRLNSDEAAAVAGQFTVLNKATLGTVNYELTKYGNPPVPVWQLTCLNPRGDQLGVIVLHATKGTILSHDGFDNTPASPVVAEPKQKKNR